MVDIDRWAEDFCVWAVTPSKNCACNAFVVDRTFTGRGGSGICVGDEFFTDVPCISKLFALIFCVNVDVHGDEQTAVQNENDMVIDRVFGVGDGAKEFHEDDRSFWRAFLFVVVERAATSEQNWVEFDFSCEVVTCIHCFQCWDVGVVETGGRVCIWFGWLGADVGGLQCGEVGARDFCCQKGKDVPICSCCILKPGWVLGLLCESRDTFEVRWKYLVRWPIGSGHFWAETGYGWWVIRVWSCVVCCKKLTEGRCTYLRLSHISYSIARILRTIPTMTLNTTAE
jgi:hypothetical protein